jgi:hypothetical protein
LAKRLELRNLLNDTVRTCQKSGLQLWRAPKMTCS